MVDIQPTNISFVPSAREEERRREEQAGHRPICFAERARPSLRWTVPVEGEGWYERGLHQ